ncbi:MAG: preprotein translocase subunit YajC [Alphaproteobacteria bacterium]|nr:preprotein translocase subunit YajC [Alphaproteobacteria bacterium]
MSLISSAFAQEVAATTAAAAGEPNVLAGFMPIFLILIVFYFLLIRPQQKKYKDHLAVVTAIGKGDTIVTSGGIVGKVTKVDAADANALFVEIADGVEVKVIRHTVSAVIDSKNKPEPKTPAAKKEKTPAAATKASPKKKASAS